ncbi:hypothetical protein J437_LFUL003656 [Ladona fulva]|uniref:Calcineurin-like phosphoesterase domain-containing protein n=1 Tax=Ladona fulva TaxID=123851 RepID=A0A8K0NZP4_LADFU|nr:hypothetical protein J437_LFUL003656 [Ladona fulva]
MILSLVVVVIFYVEYVTYYINVLKWPSIKCPNSECLKILLVADPQILGEKTESFIARWDSDRYLAKNFKLAMNHVKPELVIFLGDLMDEGSIASEEEYTRLKVRFFKIFKEDENVQILYLPGDNDIGGEGNERVTQLKYERYQKTFDGREAVSIKFAEFIKVNRITESYPSLKIVNTPKANISRVLLSHLPLLPASSGFVERVLSQLRPHLIFSAHDHKSFHFDADVDVKSGRIVGHYHVFPLGGSDVALKTAAARKAQGKTSFSWMFYLGDSIVHEIMVPTCSYRMGVPYMGFGAATLSPLATEGVEIAYEDEYDSVDSINRENSKMVLYYSMMWLPSRLFQLKFYVYFVAATVFMVFFLKCPICNLRFIRG